MNVYSRLVASGSYLPQKYLTNADLANKVSTSDEWIIERTGIKKRHIAAQFETTTFMALQACQKLFSSSKVLVAQIDLIIVATCTSDNVFPNTACQLQNLLSAKNNITAFDVSAACNGFMLALDIADKYIRTGMAKTALVVGSETMSRIIDWRDRNTCILFGDGAGAVLLQRSNEPGFIASRFVADGAKENLLKLENRYNSSKEMYVSMQGPELFRTAVAALTQITQDLISDNNYNVADIDWLIPHQANIRIINAVAEKINLPLNKVITTIAEHANTSSASIALALDLMIRNKKIKKNDLLLLNAFGGGLSSGAILLKY